MPAEKHFRVAGLTVPERVPAVLWQKAGVTHATARQMMIRRLIEEPAHFVSEDVRA